MLRANLFKTQNVNPLIWFWFWCVCGVTCVQLNSEQWTIESFKLCTIYVRGRFLASISINGYSKPLDNHYFISQYMHKQSIKPRGNFYRRRITRRRAVRERNCPRHIHTHTNVFFLQRGTSGCFYEAIKIGHNVMWLVLFPLLFKIMACLMGIGCINKNNQKQACVQVCSECAVWRKNATLVVF